MAYGLVFAGIGLHFGAIEGPMTQAHHAGLGAQPQDLPKQIDQGLAVAALEFTESTVIELLVAGLHSESQALVAGPLDPAAGRRRCPRSSRKAAAASIAALKAAPTSAAQTPSPREDSWTEQGSEPVRDPAHSPDPAGNTTDGHPRVSHSVMAVAGSAPAARVGRTWAFACPIPLPGSTAVNDIWADSRESVERQARIHARQAPGGRRGACWLIEKVHLCLYTQA